MTESSKASAYDLSRLNEGQLSAVFLRHGGDVSVLQDLNQELKRRNNDAANDLHMKVARALRTVTEGRGTRPLSHPAYVWLQAFWAARLLGGADGRSLHRYRMTDDEYAQAKEVLRRLAVSGRLIQPNQRAAALFVAYCADWYRRESTTTFLRWEDSTQELGASVPDAVKRDMAKFGLEFWRRPLRRSTHAREFLLTIALEGGFPVRILADGARGWLKDYLRAVMRQAIAWSACGLDEIREIAENERGRMRRGYQHEDFLALCSELACKLLEFRREAEAAGDGGIRNTALLDARHPGWRDELPIYVPEADEGLATELLTGLLDDKMTGLATDGVEARRYLVRRDGVWHPALQLRADGEIAPAKLLGFPTTSRARATPLGELANHLAGEVALFEPPVGEQRRWRVRPCIRTGKLLVGFPLTAPVVATLTSPDRMPTAWGWPRGDALRSELLVFTTDDGATPKEPLLRFLRSGSTSSSAKSLYALIPRDWLVEPSCNNAVVTVEDVTSLERKLVHISATVYFRAGANETIRYRVEPDADERDQALTLQHWNPSGFALTDTAWELVAGPVCPVLSEGTKRRPPAVGELYVRRPGGRWTALAGPLRDTGPVELSWRDPVANIQIERRQLVIMPDDATIVGRMTNGTRGEIRLDGLSGWTASVRASGCAVESTQPDLLSFHFVGRPLYRLPLTLRPPVGPAFDVVVSLMGRDAVIALADGAVVAPCQQIDVGALRGAVALSPTRSVLRLSAKGEKSASVQTVVDGELPIGVLRSAISETFATLTDQDEMVEVEFLGDTRPPIRLSRYRNWVQLRKDQTVRWPDLSLEGPVRPVARMILAPRHEHALEEMADDGAWRIPDHCSGPCLVYLRDGVDVLSRPIHIEQPGTPQAHSGGLTSALVVTDFTERQRAIAEALASVGHESSANDLEWLRIAVSSLRGLPASVFDALKLLPSYPGALIHLLLSGRDAGERGAIWALQNELPFLWLALPCWAWLVAARQQWSLLTAALAPILGEVASQKEALAWLERVVGDLVALEPALASRFAALGLSTAVPTTTSSLRDLVSAYVRGQDQREDEPLNDLGARLAAVGLKLPREIQDTTHSCFVGLFAPVLLAAAAWGKLVLDRELSLVIRRALREDPAYVSAAWPHLIRFYG